MLGRTDELNSSLTNKLVSLAQKYESAEFLLKDPSQFMHRYTDERTAEAVAFLAANLAFGRREQILSHVELILNAAGKSPVNWVLSKKYEDFFPENEHSFYRMYTNHDMRLFFDGLRSILEKHETIGDFFKEKWEREQRIKIKETTDYTDATDKIYLHQIIASAFPSECKLLPHSKDCAAKKVNMLLRWLVRTDSPVDLGLWTWFNKKDLLMPLDTHVMRQANELALIHSKSANLRTALALTKKVAEIFPDDPTKADFALFGLGVSLQ
ncbi:MAG: TIGR02757 family protein [Treponema sp.]|nr:TIGR02757 family protein [Treponema sp.]